MKFRKLRIAWSATFGVLCLLLIVLWMRSYWTIDGVSYYGVEDAFVIESWKGIVSLERSMDPYLPKGLGLCLRKNDPSIVSIGEPINIPGFAPSFASTVEPEMPDGVLGFAFQFVASPQERNWLALVPYWFGVLLMAMLASLPWLPSWSRRFTLRTLLIATTLVAVVLGLIVAVLRWPTG